jgi:CRP/FNR family transcriptional regulator, cyclic AMP receptor protein
MVVQNKCEAVKCINFFNGLTDSELIEVANICKEHDFGAGELCQIEGQSTNKINLIVKGRVGAVRHIPNVTYCSSEIILDTLHDGEVFGWSALIKGTPWSTLRVLDPTEVLTLDAGELLDLCESNNHIGYILMKNLSTLIASRLRRNRMSILNAIVAIRGEY